MIANPGKKASRQPQKLGLSGMKLRTNKEDRRCAKNDSLLAFAG
jgi:hypothetical protein